MVGLLNILDLFSGEELSDEQVLNAARPALCSEFDKKEFRGAVEYLKGGSSTVNEIVTMFDDLKFDILEARNGRTSVLLELRSDADHLASSSNDAIVSYVDGSLSVVVDEYDVAGIDDERDLPVELSARHRGSFEFRPGDSFVIRAGLRAHRIRGIVSPIIVHRLNAVPKSHFNHYFDYPSLRFRHSAFADQARTRDHFYVSALYAVTLSMFDLDAESDAAKRLFDVVASSLPARIDDGGMDAATRWKAVQVLGLVDADATTAALERLARSGLPQLGGRAAEALSAIVH